MSAVLQAGSAGAGAGSLSSRRIVASAGWSASLAAFAVAIAVLALVFGFVVVQGIPALRPLLFTTVTNGVSGGLANAISGTCLLVTGGVLLTVVIGIGTGIWLAEYGRGWLGDGLRFLSDVLAGVPSIVIGYFGYALLVQRLGWNFSLAAGSIALALIMLPYVVRGTDQSLAAVPRELREGSDALGADPTQTLFGIAMPYAFPSILTSLLLATGIAIGETAPLIYTAGWSNYMPSLALTHSPVGYLTYVVWTFISQPFAQSHALAYAAAVILMLMIFTTNVVARLALGAIAKRQRGA
ncbi:MAG: phosphate ABC transporter permease PstA [Candidatus Eremiobacteraeota bacterium]|nr:phosphate ABC transporter permease PstA [Candidatus Eremiobacteraeota bacterium]